MMQMGKNAVTRNSHAAAASPRERPCTASYINACTPGLQNREHMRTRYCECTEAACAQPQASNAARRPTQLNRISEDPKAGRQELLFPITPASWLAGGLQITRKSDPFTSPTRRRCTTIFPDKTWGSLATFRHEHKFTASVTRALLSVGLSSGGGIVLPVRTFITQLSLNAPQPAMPRNRHHLHRPSKIFLSSNLLISGCLLLKRSNQGLSAPHTP